MKASNLPLRFHRVGTVFKIGKKLFQNYQNCMTKKSSDIGTRSRKNCDLETISTVDPNDWKVDPGTVEGRGGPRHVGDQSCESHER